MSTDTAAPIVLRRFDGFPYLLTRIVPALYHVIVVPARLATRRYGELFLRQTAANQLQTWLVFGHQAAWHGGPGVACTSTAGPPFGGVILSDRLASCAVFEPSPDLQARRARLARFIAARNASGYLLGDPAHAGRPATSEELEALAGLRSCGVPRGLEQCRVCGEWRGQCLNPRAPGMLIPVHCQCDNDNRCAACGGLLAERRLNGNLYDEVTREIWHVPGFCGLSHRCGGDA